MQASSPDAIERAAAILQQGGLVALPTETVYGLGARADDEKAVQKIFDAKGRPAVNPLIIHVPDLDSARNYAVFNEAALAVAQAFWPGPLTLVLPLRPDAVIAPQVTAGLQTIAIRVPAHKTARALLEKVDFPIAAPSANKSGTISPTRAIHVAQSLGDKVDMILADKDVNVGLESTIIDLSSGTPTILREGGVSDNELAMYLSKVTLSTRPNGAPKSPGQMFRHYAPALPLRLRAVDVGEDEALLAFGSTRFMSIKGGGPVSGLPESAIRNLSETGDLNEAAANLYAMLHDLDHSGKSGIAVMDIPDMGIGKAINDRLQRAAEKGGPE